MCLSKQFSSVKNGVQKSECTDVRLPHVGMLLPLRQITCSFNFLRCQLAHKFLSRVVTTLLRNFACFLAEFLN